MRTYLDTSFLVSLYSPDANSQLAAHMLRAQTVALLVSTLGELELLNALELRVFRKEISPASALSSRNDFESDILNGVLLLTPLPEQSFERARFLSLQSTAKLGIRTADLLHVAIALELKADNFYTFDRQQKKLAQSVRLKTN